MQITTATATQIITEINNVIPYKINIINQEGVIIASSDKQRLNQIHAGARCLIEQQQDELRVSGDEEYDGGKPGTNFPITVRGEILGVIGITGVYEEICPYAQIIKRMTEILIHDDYLKNEQMKQVYLKNSFLYEWIHVKSSPYEKELYEKGILLGFDIRKKRRFLSVKADKTTSEKDMFRIEQYVHQKLFGDREYFVLRMASSFLIGVHDCSDQDLLKWLHVFQEDVRAMLDILVYIGVDLKASEVNNVYRQYVQAKQAMRAGMRQHSQILYYKNVTMDLFVEEVSETTKHEFISKVFHVYSNDERKEVVDMLECYYRNNGSIQKTSEELYLHKNTLQNRLNRIKERTGFDPRGLEDIPVFSIAIHFYHYQEMQL